MSTPKAKKMLAQKSRGFLSRQIISGARRHTGSSDFPVLRDPNIAIPAKTESKRKLQDI
ncbi:MAG: hypothetical protein WDM89_05370 [Rhizomicrobium sp.]